MQLWCNDLESFHRTEHRDRRRNDAVTIEQRGADQSEDDDELLEVRVGCPPLLLKHESEQGEDSTFTAIVGAQNEDQVFDADDEDERPDYEGENAVDVRRRASEPVLFLEALAERVEWTRPDVAVDDTECDEGQLSESLPGRMRLGVIADLGLPGLCCAYISSWAPSSTTRLGGMEKYSVAVREFRDMKM